jgi:hypothetical protein
VRLQYGPQGAREAKRVSQTCARANESRALVAGREDAGEKVAGYEAHLSRGLYKSLHELEALQARRLGGVSPLARLYVEGLPAV